MKLIFSFVLIFFSISCSKQKTVLICGDHVCINKEEAKQHFEENLSLEVKIVDNKINRELDLVELNLRDDNKGNRKISLSSKRTTNRDLKILSNEEIMKIKENIKIKNNSKKANNKLTKKNENINIEKTYKEIEVDNNDIKLNKESKKSADIVDICTILVKCSIEEISKYLLEQGKKRNYPDITRR